MKLKIAYVLDYNTRTHANARARAHTHRTNIRTNLLYSR